MPKTCAKMSALRASVLGEILYQNARNSSMYGAPASTWRSRSEDSLIRVAHGDYVIGVERGMSQSLALQVAQGAVHRLEHFARFGLRQWRLRQRGGQCIVGMLEHGVEDDVAREFGPPAIQ